MSNKKVGPHRIFPSAKDDDIAASRVCDSEQTRSSSYGLAYADKDFLLRDELRPARFQLELLKAELTLQDKGIHSLIVVFGSSRIVEEDIARQRLHKAQDRVIKNPDDDAKTREVRIAQRLLKKSRYYDEAREFARLVTAQPIVDDSGSLVIATGGGGGIMEAANRGAHDAGGQSVGLNIVLPSEQHPNVWTTPELSFQFHYFAIRKMHFLMRARALVVFPGGFGTLDELFETLTLIQTQKINPVPVLLFGQEYWQRIIDFDELLEEGVVGDADLSLFHYVNTAQLGWDVIHDYCSV